MNPDLQQGIETNSYIADAMNNDPFSLLNVPKASVDLSPRSNSIDNRAMAEEGFIREQLAVAA